MSLPPEYTHLTHKREVRRSTEEQWMAWLSVSAVIGIDDPSATSPFFIVVPVVPDVAIFPFSLEKAPIASHAKFILLYFLLYTAI
jgi:hypothetical protein